MHIHLHTHRQYILYKTHTFALSKGSLLGVLNGLSSKSHTYKDRVLATKPHDGLSINRITGVGDGDDFSTKGILRLG